MASLVAKRNLNFFPFGILQGVIFLVSATSELRLATVCSRDVSLAQSTSLAISRSVELYAAAWRQRTWGCFCEAYLGILARAERGRLDLRSLTGQVVLNS